MQQLKQYDEARQDIYNYFNYEEEWRVFPIADYTRYYWKLSSETRPDSVMFSDSKEIVLEEDGNSKYFYHEEICRGQVMTGKEYTAIIVDTNTDGNIFFSVFSNDKKITNTNY